MKIIDFHTHPFIRQENCSCFYDGIVNGDNFKDIIESAGINMICGSVIRRTEDFEVIRRLNAEAAELGQRWKGFYIPGIHIHPKYAEKSIEEIRLGVKSGIKLIGELVPYMNGWSTYYDEGMEEIYREIDRQNMIVSVHTDPNRDMDGLEKAVGEFKNIIFVAAHPHQKAHYYRHIDMLKKYDNYFLDLSGTGLFRYGMLKTLVNSVGSQKILFGTDFPISNPAMYVKAVYFENIKENDMENIFYKNAEMLLKQAGAM